jgi:hypothetical protein
VNSGQNKRRFWHPYEDEVLRRLYPVTKTEHLALYFDRSARSLYQRATLLGVKKSAEWLASEEACLLRRRPEVGALGRFKPGHVPANKGLRRPGWAPGRMASTQFKKGEMAGAAQKRWKPLGTKRISRDGYLEVKFRERKGQHGNWKGVHTMLWEEKHGPVPKGFALAFKDGDRTNIRLSNLELISRVELMKRNSVHNLPMELQAVIQLAGALKRKVRETSEAYANGTV